MTLKKKSSSYAPSRSPTSSGLKKINLKSKAKQESVAKQIALTKKNPRNATSKGPKRARTKKVNLKNKPKQRRVANQLVPTEKTPSNTTSRGPKGSTSKLVHTDTDFFPDLDTMAVTLGNTLTEMRGRNRIRTNLSACPDTGASRSICSPALANNLGARKLALLPQTAPA